MNTDTFIYMFITGKNNLLFTYQEFGDIYKRRFTSFFSENWEMLMIYKDGTEKFTLIKYSWHLDYCVCAFLNISI